MAENAGGIFVSIDADASPLISQFTKTEAQARAAGQQIAQNLGRGLEAGSQQLKIFNALLAQSGTEAGLARNAQLQLATALAGTARAAQAADGAVKSTGSDVLDLGKAFVQTEGKAQSFVGVIPGLGRAAEHFINLLPGVGQAIMAAFPVLGALALAQNLIQIGGAIGHAIGGFGEMSEKEKKAAEDAKNIADQIKRIGENIQQIDFKIMEDSLGRTAAKAIEAAKATVDAASGAMAARRALLQSMATEQRTSQTGAEVLEGVANKGDKKVDKAVLNEIALVDAELYKLSRQAVLYSKESAKSQKDDNKTSTADAKQELADRRTAFKAFYDDQLADLKANHEVTHLEELRFRKQELADARTQGPGMAPVATEVNRQVGTLSQQRMKDIETASKNFQTKQEHELKQSQDIKIQVMRGFWADVREGLNETANDFEREQDLERREIVATTTARNRAAQEGIRAKGIKTDSADELATLRIEADYSRQIVHTRAEELRYAQDIGKAEEKRLQDALDTAQALKDYADQNLLIADQNSADLAVVRARADLDRQRLESETRIAKIQQSQQLSVQLRRVVTQDINQLGDEIGQAIGAGIIHHNLGQEIMQSIKNTGQRLITDFFSEGIKAALEASGVNKAAHKLADVIFGTPGNTATGQAASGGLIGKLGQILHLPGSGNAAAQAAAQQRQVQIAAQSAAASRQIATQQSQAVTIAQQQQTTLNTMEGTLQQILAAIKSQHTMAGGIIGGITGGLIGGLIGLAGGGGGGGDASADEGGFLKQDMLVKAHRGEYILNPNQVAGREALPDFIMPGIPTSGGASMGSQLLTASQISNSSSQSQSNVFHLHGVRNVEDFARRLPAVLKSRAPNFSPASR